MIFLFIFFLELFWNNEEQNYFDIIVNKGNNTMIPIKHIGYINLFPFIMGLIPKDSPKLLKILEILHNPNYLWSSYGIRSLSISDKYFGTGENYWKGINYHINDYYNNN